MADRMTTIPLNDIKVNQSNLRKELTDIEELAQSIAFVGLLEPLRVQKSDNGWYLVAGHRRHAALMFLHKQGQLDSLDIKCVTGDQLDDAQWDAAMVIENMQRVNLTLREEAEGVRRLVTEHGLSQADVATSLGVTKQWVSDRVAVIGVPEDIFDKKLNNDAVVMFGKLDEKQQQKILKAESGVSQYKIEDQFQKQQSNERTERIVAKAHKAQQLVVTMPNLKKIIKADIGSLDGIDFMIKSKIGSVSEIVDSSWEKGKDEYFIRLARTPGKAEDAIANIKAEQVFVFKKDGGFWRLYELQIIQQQVTEDGDAELDEYEQMQERNDIKKAEWFDQAYADVARQITSMKPAELTKRVLVDTLHDALRSSRNYEMCTRVMAALDLEVVEADYTGIDLDDHSYGTSNLKRNAERAAVEAMDATLVEYANKTAANLVRAIAALNTVGQYQFATHAKDFGFELPPEPGYEEWEEEDIA